MNRWILFLMFIFLALCSFLFVYRPSLCKQKAQKAAHDNLMMRRTGGFMDDFYREDIYNKDDLDSFYQQCMNGDPVPLPVKYGDY